MHLSSLRVIPVLFTFFSFSYSLRVYQDYDPVDLAIKKNVNAACITALNTSLPCDDWTFFSLTDPDAFGWEAANLTTLCTAGCSSALTNWVSSVSSACNGQPFVQSGTIIEAKSVPLMYKYGYDMACMKSSTNDWCFLENQQWEGQDVYKFPEDACLTGDPDIDAAACFEEDFDQTAILPEDRRLTNLYPRSVVCSDCFVKILHKRLSSPFLEDNDWTQNLITQFHDIEANCSTSIPLATSSSTLFVGTVPKPTATATTTISESIVASATTTCAGQLVSPTSAQFRCRALSDAYGVPDGEIVVTSGSQDCEFDAPICLPAPCELDIITTLDETCDTLRAKYSTTSNPITLLQFLTWNRRLLGTCDQVYFGQGICKGPPGGAYVKPPPIYAPSGTTAYYSTATPPVPTSTGTTEDCGKYHSVAVGDTCQTIAVRYGITFAQFQALNTQINSDCTNLWLGYAYCIAAVTPPPVSTDGTCGPNYGNTVCTGSDCCSAYGFCGTGNDYCGAGCFSGPCDTTSASISQDGTCGPANNDWTCPDSAFGDCCSTSGYCGSTSDYCGPGNCYSGDCDPDEGGVSVDGSCGPNFAGNKVCTGSPFGACCSTSGYCGDTSDYCGPGNCYSGACQ